MTNHPHTLPAATLAALAAHVDRAAGPLYPFMVDPTTHLPARPVEPAVAAALDTMAAANAAAWVRLAGAGYALDYGAWFAPDGRCVAMSVTPDDVLIETPPRADFAGALAANVLGASALRAVELDTSLSRPAALILATAFDEAVRDAQLARAMERPLTIRGVSSTDLLALVDAAIRRDDGATAWIVGALSEHDATATADQALTACNELVGAGLFTRQGDRLRPAGPLHTLATRCSTALARLELRRAWTTPSGDVETAGLHALQYNVHDLLVAEPVGPTVRIATETAAHLIALLVAALTNTPALSENAVHA